MSAPTRQCTPSRLLRRGRLLTTGDFNNDGASDLAMVRNPAGNSPYLKVWNGFNWSTIAEQAFGYPWITLEAGRLASTNLPDQLALLRTGVGADLDSLLMFNVYSGGFSDVFPGQNGQWRYSPNFTLVGFGGSGWYQAGCDLHAAGSSGCWERSVC